MSHVVGSAEYEALAAAMLTDLKAHLRVDFADDDSSIKRYCRWSIALIENELGFRIAAVETAWSPVLVSGRDRYEVPVQPVSDFTAKDATAVDVTAEYRLEQVSMLRPAWLIRIDGTEFPTGLAVTLKSGTTDPSKLPPNIEAGIYRIAGTLYEHRESITTLSAESIPYWLRDLLDGAWIPRA